MLRLAAVVAIADAALPIALATTVGAGSCDRLRLRSVASLIASSMETLSHLDDAASDGSGDVGLTCIGSAIIAHEVEDDPDARPVLRARLCEEPATEGILEPVGAPGPPPGVASALALALAAAKLCLRR